MVCLCNEGMKRMSQDFCQSIRRGSARDADAIQCRFMFRAMLHTVPRYSLLYKSCLWIWVLGNNDSSKLHSLVIPIQDWKKCFFRTLTRNGQQRGLSLHWVSVRMGFTDGLMIAGTLNHYFLCLITQDQNACICVTIFDSFLKVCFTISMQN